MSFTSFGFLAFLAATAAVYYLLPKRSRWIALLGASYVFYIAGGGGTVVYLLATTASTYTAGLVLGRLNAAAAAAETAEEKRRLKRRKKCVVFAALLFNFGMLYVFKYWNGTLEQINALLHTDLGGTELVLPLGVSFYIFQSAGYVIDCFRGTCPPERNAAKFALFVSFFPQMVQGPIGRFGELGSQLTEGHGLNADRLKYGIQLMLWGYFKKMVIAERAGVLVNTVFDGYTVYGGAIDALGVLFYCIQLYCDFSGGIDVTRGAAQLFGIELAENFRRPIFARSLADYWRRWHITLGRWMRDYLFYPLSLSKPFGRLGRWSRRRIGGKLGKILPTSLATFIVYLVIGVWHGASFRYIVFGFWNGAIITASLLLEGRYAAAKQRLGIREEAAAWRCFQIARTSAIVFLGRYITRAPRLMTALWMLAHLFLCPMFAQLTDGTVLTLGLTSTDLAVVLLGQLTVLAAEGYQERGGHVRAMLERQHWLIQWLAIMVALLVLLLFGIMRGSYVPAGFIYQQF